MDLYRLTIQDSQDTMQFDLLDAPINIEDVEGAVDNTVLSGDIFTDFLYLKKRWEQKWAIMCKDEYERLRGFYTRQWSLATVPSVKVTQGYLRNAEWEGQIIYINAPYGGEISSLTKMTGDTSQASYTGKNKVNQMSPYGQGYIDNNGTIASTTNSVYAQEYFDVEADTAYTVSWTVVQSGSSVRKIAFYDSSKTILSRSSDLTNGGTFTTPAGTAFIRFYLNNPNGMVAANAPLTYLKDIQIEKGSSKTSFEPFVGGIPSPNPDYPQPIQTVTGEQTVTINGQAFTIDLGAIELCKLGDAQDSIYYDGSSWKIEKQVLKFTPDGSENWFRSGGTTQTHFVAALAISSLKTSYAQRAGAKSTHFAYMVSTGPIGQRPGFTLYNNSGGVISNIAFSLPVATANDIATAKAWLATNRPSFYISLDSTGVTETTITDTDLIAQLEAVRAALIEGQNLVEVTANGGNLPAKSITLQGIEGRENPILPQTNVRIGLSDGGVLNACECRQNVTLSMRETA